MKNRWQSSLGCIMIAAAALSGTASLAQHAASPPSLRSYSNGGTTTTPASGEQALKEPSQEQLADAVLADTMRLLWEQTDRHFHRGEFNHLINLNRIITQGDPHNMDAYSNSAYLLWSTGRNEEAVKTLNDGIAANPSGYYMYDEMGRYWSLERKDPKSAIPYLEKAVKFDCPWTTWNVLANCYEQTRQWDKAVGAWEKATLYPNDPVALRRLRQAREKRAQQGGP